MSSFTHAAEPVGTPVPKEAPFPFPLLTSPIKIENGEYKLVEHRKIAPSLSDDELKLLVNKF